MTCPIDLSQNINPSKSSADSTHFAYPGPHLVNKIDAAKDNLDILQHFRHIHSLAKTFPEDKTKSNLETNLEITQKNRSIETSPAQMPDIEGGSDWRGVILQLTVKRENKMLGRQSGEPSINAVSDQTPAGPPHPTPCLRCVFCVNEPKPQDTRCC